MHIVTALTTTHRTNQDNVAGLYHYPPVSGGCSSSLFLQDSSVESSESLQTADLCSTWVCRDPGLWCPSLEPGAPTAVRGCSVGPQEGLEGPGSGEMECKLNHFVFTRHGFYDSHALQKHTQRAQVSGVTFMTYT